MLRAFFLLAAVIEFVATVAMAVQGKPLFAGIFGVSAGLILVAGLAQD